MVWRVVYNRSYLGGFLIISEIYIVMNNIDFREYVLVYFCYVRIWLYFCSLLLLFSYCLVLNSEGIRC